MTKTFRYHLVGSYRDGSAPLELDGDITIHDDVTTYVYRDVPATEMGEFFDWATGLFCVADEPRRLDSRAGGWHVEGGFTPPEPIPADDSDEYQGWLDDAYTQALDAWVNEYRPAQKSASP